MPLEDVDLEQPNKMLAAAFEERFLLLIDPLDNLREAADQGLTLHGLLDRHFNKEGHQVIAEYLMSFVEIRL